MNAASLNNLWSYLQGLSLTSANRKWLAEKLSEDDTKLAERNPAQKKYILSPRMQKLMGCVKITPKDIEEDERLKYILSK